MGEKEPNYNETPTGPGVGAAGSEWAENFMPGSAVDKLFNKETKDRVDGIAFKQDALDKVEFLLFKVNTTDEHPRGLVDENVGMLLLKTFKELLGYFHVSVKLRVYDVIILLLQKMGGHAKAFCETEEVQEMIRIIFQTGCLGSSVDKRVSTAAYKCLDELVKVMGIEAMFPYLHIIVGAPLHVKGVFRLAMLNWLKQNLSSEVKKSEGALQPLLALTITCIDDHKNSEVRKKYEKFLETVLNNVGRQKGLFEAWDDLPDNTKKMYLPEREAYLNGTPPPPPPRRKTFQKTSLDELKKQRKSRIERLKTPRANANKEENMLD